MIGLWCLPRFTEEEKRLTIKCGDSRCRPSVYDGFSCYIILYSHNDWWFRYDKPMCGHLTDGEVKELREMAQANYEMYCERHREGE
ncbi:MAG: hypothetical protein E6422_07465 [Veillonella sp.]|uniref:hypothetical protein n=1 Tax=Veillonella sp. TaxID=1926307 RepID=UPI002907AA4B|nr:hypothetical protein [Veillonella sp.]MDU6732042.1 hypothetical protein [Staphylococcus epidermidis]MDU6787966.1 hypothetical protein [Veillonella sp.]